MIKNVVHHSAQYERESCKAERTGNENAVMDSGTNSRHDDRQSVFFHNMTRQRSVRAMSGIRKTTIKRWARVSERTTSKGR